MPSYINPTSRPNMTQALRPEEARADVDAATLTGSFRVPPLRLRPIKAQSLAANEICLENANFTTVFRCEQRGFFWFAI